MLVCSIIYINRKFIILHRIGERLLRIKIVSENGEGRADSER